MSVHSGKVQAYFSSGVKGLYLFPWEVNQKDLYLLYLIGSNYFPNFVLIFFRQVSSMYYRYPVCNIILLLLRGSSFVPFLLFLLPFIKYILHIYMQDSTLSDGGRPLRLDRFSTLKEVSFSFGREIVNKRIHNCHFNYR